MRSSCIAFPPIAARGSPTRGSTARNRSDSTKRKTDCTRKRAFCPGALTPWDSGAALVGWAKRSVPTIKSFDFADVVGTAQVRLGPPTLPSPGTTSSQALSIHACPPQIERHDLPILRHQNHLEKSG